MIEPRNEPSSKVSHIDSSDYSIQSQPTANLPSTVFSNLASRNTAMWHIADAASILRFIIWPSL